jgi:hypothetical protein
VEQQRSHAVALPPPPGGQEHINSTATLASAAALLRQVQYGMLAALQSSNTACSGPAVARDHHGRGTATLAYTGEYWLLPQHCGKCSVAPSQHYEAAELHALALPLPPQPPPAQQRYSHSGTHWRWLLLQCYKKCCAARWQHCGAATPHAVAPQPPRTSKAGSGTACWGVTCWLPVGWHQLAGGTSAGVPYSWHLICPHMA